MNTTFVRSADGSYILPNEFLFVPRGDQDELRTTGEQLEPTVSAIPMNERESLFRNERAS